MKLRNEVRSGLFIAVTMALLITLVFIMGQERQIFAEQEEFYATFRDVKGLNVGAPIRMGGITIGRVAKVGFSEDLTDLKIHVTLLVNEEYLDRIRMGSVVGIETQGLLGDRFVTISPSQEQTPSAPKTTLRSIEVEDFGQVMGKAQVVADNVAEITQQLKQTISTVKPEFFEGLGAAAENLSKILDEIHTGNGFLHRLVYSEKDGAKLITALTTSASDFQALITEIRTGNGILHALFFDKSGDETVRNFSRALANVGEASATVGRVFQQAENGEGLIHDLFYTRVEPGEIAGKIRDVVAKLNETAEGLRVVAASLSNGTGTLGALIVDPRVYDNLVEVTDGAKRSFLLRQAIRSSLGSTK